MKKIIALCMALLLLLPSFTAYAAGDVLTMVTEPVGDYDWEMFFLGSDKDDYNNRPDFIEGLGAAVSRVNSDSKNNCGVLGIDGKMVIEAEYASLGGLVDGKYLIAHKKLENGKSTGLLLDFSGKVIIPAGKYEKLGTVYGSEMMIAVKDGKAGVITADEKVVIPFEYDTLGCTGKGFFTAMKDDKYGVIDNSGKTVIPIRYSAFIFGQEDGTFSTYFKGNTIYLDADGKVLENYDPTVQSKKHEPTELEKKLDGMGYTLKKEYDDFYAVELKGRENACTSGALSKSFNVIIPTEFEFIRPVDRTEYIYAKPRETTVPKYFDKEGNVIENCYKVHPYLDVFFIDPKSSTDVDKCDMTDSDGKVVIPGIYEPASSILKCGENLYLMKTRDNKMMYVEKNGTGKNVMDYVPGLRLKIDSAQYKVGSETKQNDVAPVIRNGRTMLPARLVAERFGCTVEWNGETQEIIIKKDTEELVRFTVGSQEAKVFGVRPFKLLAAPFIENGRTYVPIRELSEAINADIYWNAEEKTVDLVK